MRGAGGLARLTENQAGKAVLRGCLSACGFNQGRRAYGLPSGVRRDAWMDLATDLGTAPASGPTRASATGTRRPSRVVARGGGGEIGSVGPKGRGALTYDKLDHFSEPFFHLRGGKRL